MPDSNDLLIAIAGQILEQLFKDRAKLTDQQRAALDANFSDYQARIARAEAAANVATEG